jgi:hypothetical protein
MGGNFEEAGVILFFFQDCSPIQNSALKVRILQKFGKAPCTGDRTIAWPVQDNTNIEKMWKRIHARMELELPIPTFEYHVPQTAYHIVNLNVSLILLAPYYEQ